MTWVRIDENFPEHPKIISVGGDAGWLHVCALSYCNRNMTNGHIPKGAIARLSDRKRPSTLADRLVEVGLWEVDGDGWLIHDYLLYQPSRVEVEASRERSHTVKAEAGRLGGIASGVARRKHNRSRPEAETEANGKRNEAPTRPDPTRSSYISDDDDSLDTPNGRSSSVEDQVISLTAKALARKDRTEPAGRFIDGIARNVRVERLTEVRDCIAEGMTVHDAAVKLVGSSVYVELAEMLP